MKVFVVLMLVISLFLLRSLTLPWVYFVFVFVCYHSRAVSISCQANQQKIAAHP